MFKWEIGGHENDVIDTDTYTAEYKWNNQSQSSGLGFDKYIIGHIKIEWKQADVRLKEGQVCHSTTPKLMIVTKTTACHFKIMNESKLFCIDAVFLTVSTCNFQLTS